MILVQRVITRDIECLQMLSDVVLRHIPHIHSKEMSQKADMVYIYTTFFLFF